MTEELVLDEYELKKFDQFRHEVDFGNPHWVDEVNETNYPVILKEGELQSILVRSVKPVEHVGIFDSYMFQTSAGEYEFEAKHMGTLVHLYFYDDNVSYSDIENLLATHNDLIVRNRLLLKERKQECKELAVTLAVLRVMPMKKAIKWLTKFKLIHHLTD